MISALSENHEENVDSMFHNLPQKNHRQNLLGNKFLVHLKIVFVWSPTIFFLSLFELVLNDLTAENFPTVDKLIIAK